MSGTRYEPPLTEGKIGELHAEGTAETLAAPGIADTPLLPPVDKSNYELGEEFARGGLGRILQATDKRLDRPVAIKELLHEGADYTARFAREALLTARLQHPAIVPVYEAGVWNDGSPFYAMKLVSGKSLEAAVREKGTLSERLALLPHVIDVVEALAYAHERRIIHRDLKPANVLVGAFGETVVIDWGLAKDLSSSEPEPAMRATRPSGGGHTQAGSVLGTPAYMPPEQALGMPVDTRADVYSLGALLYHVITGGPPYEGVSSEHILTCVVREGPDPVNSREADAPPELCAIVSKAMARDPSDRYPIAADLAEDLNRFQRGQLVAAHRYSRVTLLARWLKRHRAPVLVGVAMLAVLIAVIVVAFQRVVAERDVARVERAEAQRLRVQADGRGDELALKEAEALLSRDPRAALGWLGRLSPETHALSAARVIAEDAISRGVPARVIEAVAYAVAFSPDGALLAVGRGGDVLVDDVATGQRVVLPGRGPVGDQRTLTFSPGGTKLAFAGLGGVVRVWDRGVRALADQGAPGADVVALAFGDEELLASLARDGSLRIHALGSGAPPRDIPGGAVDVDARGKTVVTVGPAGLLRVIDGRSGEIASLRGDGELETVRLSPDGRRMVTLSAAGALRVWDVAGRAAIAGGKSEAAITAVRWIADDQLVTADAAGGVWLWQGGNARRLGGHEDEVLALASPPLASAGRDHVVRVWDPATGRSRALLGHDGDVIALAGAGRWLASAGRDRKVRLWDLAAGQPRSLVAPQGHIRALASSADGQRLAGAGDDDVFTVEVASGETRPLGAPGGGMRAVAVSPDGAGIAVSVGDGRVLLYARGGAPALLTKLDGAPTALVFDLRGGHLAAAGPAGLRVLDAAGGKPSVTDGEPVAALAFSPGGSLLATAGTKVRLWDVDRGSFRTLDGVTGPFASLAFSGDGHLVAAGTADGVAVWTVGTAALTRLPGPGAMVDRLAFAGERMLVGTAVDRSVRAWSIEGGEPRSLAGLLGAPTCLAVSPDGRSAAAGSTDGSARLWDVESGRGRPLPGTGQPVTAVTFVDGGRAIAVASVDGALRIHPDLVPHEHGALRSWLEKMAPPN